MRWPKYWSFSFSISPSSEHPGLISFRMDWLDLFAVQETLKSLLQHHSSKASILQLCLTKSSACGRLWQFAHPRPLSLLQRGLAPSARTGASQGFPRAAAPVGVFSRGTTRISGSLSCGARELMSPCAWRGGAGHHSRVMGSD